MLCSVILSPILCRVGSVQVRDFLRWQQISMATNPLFIRKLSTRCTLYHKHVDRIICDWCWKDFLCAHHVVSAGDRKYSARRGKEAVYVRSDEFQQTHNSRGYVPRVLFGYSDIPIYSPKSGWRGRTKDRCVTFHSKIFIIMNPPSSCPAGRSFADVLAIFVSK